MCYHTAHCFVTSFLMPLMCAQDLALKKKLGKEIMIF